MEAGLVLATRLRHELSLDHKTYPPLAVCNGEALFFFVPGHFASLAFSPTLGSLLLALTLGKQNIPRRRDGPSDHC